MHLRMVALLLKGSIVESRLKMHMRPTHPTRLQIEAARLAFVAEGTQRLCMILHLLVGYRHTLAYVHWSYEFVEICTFHNNRYHFSFL